MRSTLDRTLPLPTSLSAPNRHSGPGCAPRYHARNQQIVDAADLVFALVAPDRRGGTEDTIRRAERKGIPVTIL
jgi:hypothetical protein